MPTHTKKREGGHLWSNLFLIAFTAAGLAMTMRLQFRGDSYRALIAFAVCIGISGFEILLNILILILSATNKLDRDEGGCCKCTCQRCLSALTSAFYLAGSCVCFALLVWALVSSMGIPQDDFYGCVNGYGCANIMGIIACIVYGLRVLVMAICLPCIVCAGLCACSACCLGSSERNLEGGDHPHNNL